MTQQEIIEGNKLIAEFIGLDKKPLAKGLLQNQYKHNFDKHGFSSWTNEEMLLFHSSWDWLMPVVEKIESIGSDLKGKSHGITIYRKTANINNLPLEYSNSRAETKIEAVYKLVVMFIEWYNEQQK